jgi:hypothetical protein
MVESYVRHEDVVEYGDRVYEEATVSMSGRSDQPGPDEQAELSREDQRQARDEVSERIGADAAEYDDGEETVDELLEIDQTELEELGLTLDDPHQPESE